MERYEILILKNYNYIIWNIKVYITLCFLVKQIQPTLKTEHLTDFEGIVDFSKNSEVTDITVFLCKLRDIFIKYYITIK